MDNDKNNNFWIWVNSHFNMVRNIKYDKQPRLKEKIQSILIIIMLLLFFVLVMFK
jgi:hypothetical protein